MSDKISLPKKFELRGDIYTLAYFPGDETQIEPNFKAMNPLQANSTPVKIAVGPNQYQDKFMTWCVAEIPAKVGMNVPARRFLLFRIFDKPYAPEMCPMHTMVAYAILPQQQAVSLEQQFINMILGVREERTAPPEHDDWADKLFSAPKDDEPTSEPMSAVNSSVGSPVKAETSIPEASVGA